jgi:hypothetical protein
VNPEKCVVMVEGHTKIMVWCGMTLTNFFLYMMNAAWNLEILNNEVWPLVCHWNNADDNV